MGVLLRKLCVTPCVGANWVECRCFCINWKFQTSRKNLRTVNCSRTLFRSSSVKFAVSNFNDGSELCGFPETEEVIVWSHWCGEIIGRMISKTDKILKYQVGNCREPGDATGKWEPIWKISQTKKFSEWTKVFLWVFSKILFNRNDHSILCWCTSAICRSVWCTAYHNNSPPFLISPAPARCFREWLFSLSSRYSVFFGHLPLFLRSCPERTWFLTLFLFHNS